MYDKINEAGHKKRVATLGLYCANIFPQVKSSATKQRGTILQSRASC